MDDLGNNYENLKKMGEHIRKKDIDESEQSGYVWVKGHYKEDGTRVKGHYRRLADGGIDTANMPFEPSRPRMGLFEKAKIRRQNIERNRQQRKRIYAEEYQKQSLKAVKAKARRDAMGFSLTTGERVGKVLRGIGDLGTTLSGGQTQRRQVSTSHGKKQKRKPIGGFSLTEGFDDDLMRF